MRQNAYNIVFFVFLAATLSAVWWYAERNWFPKQDRPQKDAAEVAAEKKENEKAPSVHGKPTPEAMTSVAGGAAVHAPSAPAKPVAKPTPPPYETPTLVALGGDGFFIRSLLSTRGGGVQQVVLSEFEQASRLGLAVKTNGQTAPLYLIPGTDQRHGPRLEDDPPLPDLHPGKALDPTNPNTPQNQRLVEPSYALFHYPTADDRYPDPLLGTTNWKLVEHQQPADGEHRATFETQLGDPYFVKIRKTYTLSPKDYHLGLRIQLERLPGGQKGKGVLKYQLAGPHGLPVEGEWYTSTTRTALVGWRSPRGAVRRQYEDAASIGMQRGGEAVERADNTFKYAAISTQYFTSALAIDTTDDAAAKDPWKYVRATTELPLVSMSPDDMKRLEAEAKTDPDGPAAMRLRAIRNSLNHPLQELDDITFRAVSEPLDLAPGESVTHAFAMYNGPTKVRLLKLLRADKAVNPALVDKYHDTFDLRTLTDYRSPTALGSFADAIYWTDIVVGVTNIMHYLLWAIHWVISWMPGSWGVSIIVLTVMVRLTLFVPSRKQTQMNMKMVEVQKKLKPELDKLHERYKDDFNTYNREKTRLMMQHGMNPFAAMGGCLLLFAQMPIMMGLYFGLQESIFFRLEHFLWIDNLAAPDMAVWWSEKIPIISDPANRHGTLSFLYLGPYLNILPLLAVSLMLYQQHKMMPPPTDEQQASQQRMMKIMMGVMALMFYKIAAGLALYFTISTLWGIIERQLIPKPSDKPGDGGGNTAGLSPKSGSPNASPAPVKQPGMLGRFRDRLQARLAELQKQAEEQSSRQHRNQPRGPEPYRNPDRQKKRRK